MTTSAGQQNPFYFNAGESFQWSIPSEGNPLKDYQPSTTCSYPIGLTSGDCTGSTFTCYFTTPANGAQLTGNFIDANGTTHPIPAIFNIVPPTSSMNDFSFLPTGLELLDQNGNVNTTNAWRMTLLGIDGTIMSGFSSTDSVTDATSITSQQGAAGQWAQVQFVQSSMKQTTLSGFTPVTWSNTNLESNPPGQYPGDYPTELPQHPSNPWNPSGQPYTLTDRPYTGLYSDGYYCQATTSYAGSFQDYMYYQPPPASPGSNVITVPVALYSWAFPTWTATPPTTLGGSWTASGAPTTGPTIDQTFYKTFSIPRWLQPPTNLACSTLPSNGGISLTWGAPTTAPGTSVTHTVYRSSTPGSGYLPVNTSPVTGLSYTDATPPAGAVFYVVTATISGGSSAPFSSYNSTEVTTQAPAAPSGLQSSLSNGNVLILTWNASPNATSYNILGSTTSGGPYQLALTTYFPTWTFAGSPKGTYYFVVQATCDGTTSGNSNEIKVVIN